MSIAEFYIEYGIDPNEDVCEALRNRGYLDTHGTPPKRNKKKRKNESEPTRICADCNDAKTPDKFSKNQRRKGSAGRCMECVAAK